jgi:RIO-like serine/threonine protein kinase
VLIERISHMKRSNAFKIIKTLLKHKLVVHCSKNCTSRLTQMTATS